jgi:hypothetical protein
MLHILKVEGRGVDSLFGMIENVLIEEVCLSMKTNVFKWSTFSSLKLAVCLCLGW